MRTTKLSWKRYFYLFLALVAFLTVVLFNSVVLFLLQVFKKEVQAKSSFFSVKASIKLVFYILRIKVVPYYHGNIFNREKKYIFISNHSSYLDPLICIHSIPIFFKPLAKAEFNKIPFFGSIYKTVSVGVNRKRLSSKRDSFYELVHFINQDFSILIYPEGTLNETEAPLLGFHSGAFKLAFETQTEIIPLIIENGKKCLHPSSLFTLQSGNVHLHFLPPIHPEKFINDKELKNNCHKIMNNFITKVNGHHK